MKKEILQIVFSVFLKMLKLLGSLPAEAGGIFLGPVDRDCITHFVFDKYAHTTASTYSLNVEYLNPIIKEFCDANHWEIKGICHSHPQGYRKLSPQDIVYFTSQIKKLKLKKLYVPLVFSAKEGQLDFLPFVIYADGTVVKAGLDVVSAIEISTSESVQNPIKEENKTESGNSSSWQLFNSFPFRKGYKTLLLGLSFTVFLLFVSLLPTLHTFIVQLLKF